VCLVVIAFMILAALGFALSAAVHVASLMGVQTPYAFALHVGIFVVWFPAVLFVRRKAGTSRGLDALKVAFANCPPWMLVAIGFLFVYTLVNFFISPDPPRENGSLLGVSPAGVRKFSGHWMLFYGAGFAILYSGRRGGGTILPPG